MIPMLIAHLSPRRAKIGKVKRSVIFHPKEGKKLGKFGASVYMKI
jgi:hypothetical protein